MQYMTNFKTILFDLDGTLTDPGEGITNSVAYALEKYNIKVSDRSELYKFIGPPLMYSFKEFYGFDEENCKKAVSLYREYFRNKGLFENVVYDGIPELLQKLKSNGLQLVVATSKPEEFTIRILKHFDLYKYFDFIAGATMDERRNDKADIIKYALENIQYTYPSEIIMVGDRKHDIIGAAKNGIDTIAVLYGYGNRQEFVEAGAKYIVSNIEELYNSIVEVVN